MAQKNNYRNLKYKLTDDDTIAFNQFFIRHSEAGRKTVFQQKILFPIMTVIVIPMLYFFKFTTSIVVGAGALLVAASIYMFIFADRLIMKQQEKSINKSSYSLNTLYKDDIVLEFGDEDVHSLSENMDSSFGYDKIVKVSRTLNGMYIWLDENSAMPVPESAFNKADGMSALFSFLKEKCPDAVFEEFDEKYERLIQNKRNRK